MCSAAACASWELRHLLLYPPIRWDGQQVTNFNFCAYSREQERTLPILFLGEILDGTTIASILYTLMIIFVYVTTSEREAHKCGVILLHQDTSIGHLLCFPFAGRKMMQPTVA